MFALIACTIPIPNAVFPTLNVPGIHVEPPLMVFVNSCTLSPLLVPSYAVAQTTSLFTTQISLIPRDASENPDACSIQEPTGTSVTLM